MMQVVDGIAHAVDAPRQSADVAHARMLGGPEVCPDNFALVLLPSHLTGVVDAIAVVSRVSDIFPQAYKSTAGRPIEWHLFSVGIQAATSYVARGINRVSLGPCSARKRSEIDHAA